MKADTWQDIEDSMKASGADKIIKKIVELNDKIEAEAELDKRIRAAKNH